VIDLNQVWFLLVGAIFAGYAVLDGFDLGVGALHLFSRTDEQRRLAINAIGPVWDGNEVWLVVGGGALFAAFPDVYAAVFSAFYLPVILQLFMLIIRAVAIEFRDQRSARWWRQLWDVSFCVSSVLAALMMGVALGNVIWGLPLDATGNYTGTVLDLLNPYALLTGVTTVALFTMHGALYLVLRTEGEMQTRVAGWVRNTIIFMVLSYAILTLATLLYVPQMSEHIRDRPLLFVVPVLTVLAVANIPREVYHRRTMRAFLSSCAVVFGLFCLVGIGLYPNLVLAEDPAHNLTIYNAASSAGSLRTMLIVALIGMPLVAAYTGMIYWIFRGKVRLDATSY
jgi:cytochrome d ubiquinol oxidase subunit II